MKQNWEYKKLGEVCDIVGRIGFRGYTRNDLVDSPSEGAITLSPSNIINGQLDYTNCSYISWTKYNESPEIIIKEGDVLLVKTASVGKCALVSHLPHETTINPQFVVLKKIKINNAFLTYLIQSEHEQIELKKITTGTSVPTLSQANLAKLEIPVPPLSTQTAIVSELDALSAIIADHKSLLKKYDELEQSIFYDMFGDPVKNDKGWECDAFASLFKLKSGDGLTAKDFVEGEYPVYGGNGISGHHNVFNKEGKFIIIGRVGAYCGNVRYVKGKFWLTDNAFELFFDQERFNYTWLPYLLNILDLHQFANHAAQPVISNTGLKGISIILPPLPLQQEFASKIEAIEAMKADTKKSLAKSEELFNARMDYYFNA